MISITNVTVSFGGTSLYEDISFLINKQDRIGLAGRNGAGKSTLLKILCGEQRAQKGEIAMPNGATVGYLPQDMVHNLGKTVFDETMLAFAEVKNLEKAIADITSELERRTDYETDDYMNLITRLNDVQERYHLLDGDALDKQVEMVLLGLGFERSDFNRMTDEFSGGWRMRIELAKILLQKPDLLLLDEPTNHLDIESIQWLEEFLTNYHGAIVLVSHDKAFLDNVTTRTIEISLGKIYDYKSNYSRYLILRAERRESQMNAYKNQQREIEKTEQLIDRFRAKANKASFAQSLIKKLDRMELVEVDDEDKATIHFRFPPAPRSGKIVVEALNVTKQYGPKTIFSKVDYAIERQEKIAFVGRNGEGKSTMVRLIMGEAATQGSVTIGQSVSVGYFAQDEADKLDPDRTVFQTVDDIALGEVRKQVRSLLGAFLFSGDSVDKKVKVLSGGERTRLALCRLLLQPYNLLILDEPTNHLDMRSKEVLKQALVNYDGTMIVVSHDRDFLQGLTTKVFEFRHQRVREYIGDVYEFLRTRKIDSLSDLEIADKKAAAAKEKNPEPVSTDQDQKKQQEKEIRQLKSQLTRCESEIAKLEADIKVIDDQLMDSAQYDKVMNDKSVFANYESMKKKLEEQMKAWEDIQLKIETLEK